MSTYFDPLFPALLFASFILAWLAPRRSPWLRRSLLSLLFAAWVYCTAIPDTIACRWIARTYSPAEETIASSPAAAIVVLSGDGIPPNATQVRTVLGVHTLVRLEKAYDVATARPDLPIIVSGGYLFGADRSITLAGLMKAWLVERGVASERILLDGAALSTYDSALNVSRLSCKEGKTVLLVTELLHMPRAATAFSRQGCRTVSVPCGIRSYEHLQFRDYFPTSGGLDATQALVHEIGGLAWYWWSGKL